MGVSQCEVEFRPGLNVLHGPNDLGKSTLAQAIRAALLLPCTSADGRAFVPWWGDETPAVRLVFTDASGRFYRVEKEFSEGHRGRAVLESSKDGRDWDPEAKGREVDERLRKVLAWGVPAPGGKGGVKGLPQTFIARTLLGEQGEIARVLHEGLEDDPDDSGKLRLTRALQAMAQDPRTQEILKRTQAEVDRLYTEKGKKRSGKGSPFKEVLDEINQLSAERDQVGQLLRESEMAEQQLVESQDQLLQLEDQRRAAQLRLQRGEVSWERAQAWARAQEAADAAADEVRRIDGLEQLIREREAALGEKAAQLASASAALEASRERAQDARRTLELAKEEGLRAAAEGDGQRGMRRAQLEKDAMAQEQRRAAAMERQARAKTALAQEAHARKVEADIRAAEGKRAAAGAALEGARKRLEDTERTARQLADAEAYGRWSRAARAVEEARIAVAEASEREREAAGLERDIGALAAQLGSLKLPPAEAVRRIERLERDLKEAEAGLGGGLTVAVRPRRPLRMDVTVDGGSRSSSTREAAVELEAMQSVQLSVDDLLDLTVIAGHPAQRQRVRALRKTWSDEAEPVLQAAGTKSGPELAELRRQADDGERNLALKRAELERQRARAAELGAKAASAPAMEDQLRACESELAGRDREAARVFLESLGTAWEGQAAQLRARIEGQRAQAGRDHSAAEVEIARIETELAGLRETAGALGESLERERRELGSGPTEALHAAEDESSRVAEELRRIDAAIEAIDEEAESVRRHADEALHAARRADEASSKEVELAEQRVQETRSAQDLASGELTALRAQAASVSRAAAEQKLAREQALLAALPMPADAVSEDELKAARGRVREVEARVQEADRNHAEAQGALQRVRGAVARERDQELQQALQHAKERQEQLDLDGDAWRVLLGMLLEVERTTGLHLGRALSGPVGLRFGELTGGRYGGVAIDPALRTEGVVAAGATRATELLSEGTRDQLATLLRLSIAESLKCAVVLDDHLAQTDPKRFEWFRAALRSAAATVQVIVLTCRPDDYVGAQAGPGDGPHVVDLEGVLRRAGPSAEK